MPLSMVKQETAASATIKFVTQHSAAAAAAAATTTTTTSNRKSYLTGQMQLCECSFMISSAQNHL